MAKTESMTNLLKSKDAGFSAVKANKILLELGVLAEKERPSSKYPDKIKKYKVLTEKGLEFGINRENPSSPEQTTPYYFVDKFDDLLILIEDKLT